MRAFTSAETRGAAGDAGEEAELPLPVFFFDETAIHSFEGPGFRSTPPKSRRMRAADAARRPRRRRPLGERLAGRKREPDTLMPARGAPRDRRGRGRGERTRSDTKTRCLRGARRREPQSKRRGEQTIRPADILTIFLLLIFLINNLLCTLSLSFSRRNQEEIKKKSRRRRNQEEIKKKKSRRNQEEEIKNHSSYVYLHHRRRRFGLQSQLRCWRGLGRG